MPPSHSSNNPAPAAFRFARLRNEIGQLQSAPTGFEHFAFYGHGPNILFLGLGPEPEQASQALCQHLNLPPNYKEAELNISFIECPPFTKAMQQLNPDWASAIAPCWQELQLEELPRCKAWNMLEQEPFAAEKICIALYQPGLKLFPSFFMPLAAKIKACQYGLGAKNKTQGQSEVAILPGSQAPKFETKTETKTKAAPKILLAGNPQDLLIPDLICAFEQEGFNFCGLPASVPSADSVSSAAHLLRGVPLCPPEKLAPLLPKLLATNCPDFFFSLNFKGLDPLGEVYHLLNTLGVKVATWCVDNPWHLLSSLRAPYWRDVTIFVTDASFIEPLKKHGAKEVYHLPLATSPQFFCPASAHGSAVGPRQHKLLFAGRTAFPNKNSFFAGCRLPDDLLPDALLPDALLPDGLQSFSAQDSCPARFADFDYWVKRLQIHPLWPGQEVRRAGLAAEECSLLWRKACVEAALPLGLSLYGDAGWQEVLPACAPNLHTPLDYYTQLPRAYQASEIVLSLTSLLLPAGLNQRHFDAWAAGSICLTDNTPGLAIFPCELLEHICFKSPAELELKAREIASSPALQNELKQRWQTLILNEHTYARRVQSIKKVMC